MATMCALVLSCTVFAWCVFVNVTKFQFDVFVLFNTTVNMAILTNLRIGSASQTVLFKNVIENTDVHCLI